MLLIVLLTHTTKLNGQVPYVSFPDSNALWSEANYNVPANFCYGTDTLINDKVYHNILKNENCFNENGGAEFGIREENKQIFMYYFENQKETKLYDFNLSSIGDTVHTSFYIKSQNQIYYKEYFAELIDTTLVEMLDGTTRKAYYLGFWRDIDDSQINFHTHFVEGIGSFLGLLYEEVEVEAAGPPPGIYVNEEDHTLLCLSTDDSLTYQLSNELGCEHILQGVGVKDVNFKSVKLYPNPLNRNQDLFIETNYPLEIKVFSNLGELVFGKSVQGNTNINLSQLPTGVYYVKITNKNYSSTKKIIIQ